MVQKWKANWVNQEGIQREFVFYSLNNPIIARIDLRLKFRHAFKEEAIPEQYDIEEIIDGGDLDQRTYCTLLVL